MIKETIKNFGIGCLKTKLKNKRSHENMSSEVYDQGDDKEFWDRLPEDEVEEEDEETLIAGTKELFKELFRLSDAEGAMNFDKVGEGDSLSKELFKELFRLSDAEGAMNFD